MPARDLLDRHREGWGGGLGFGVVEEVDPRPFDHFAASSMGMRLLPGLSTGQMGATVRP
jgi:hypothetical protein